MRTRTVNTPDLRLTTPRRGTDRTCEDRVRDAGGPQDLAFYRCSCGYSFSGDVSTHVSCPHCGTDQRW